LRVSAPPTPTNYYLCLVTQSETRFLSVKIAWWTPTDIQIPLRHRERTRFARGEVLFSSVPWCLISIPSWRLEIPTLLRLAL